MRDDQSAPVEHQVRDQAVAETSGLRQEVSRFTGQLAQRLSETVGELHVATPQGLDQLVLMVSGYGHGMSCVDHPHHQPQHAR